MTSRTRSGTASRSGPLRFGRMTSVNPARSFGPALFAGGTALEQVWVFLLAPAVGGLLAAAVYPLTRAAEVVEAPAVETPEGDKRSADEV